MLSGHPKSQRSKGARESAGEGVKERRGTNSPKTGLNNLVSKGLEESSSNDKDAGKSIFTRVLFNEVIGACTEKLTNFFSGGSLAQEQ